MNDDPSHIKVCHACLGPFYFIFPAKFETNQLLHIIVLRCLQVIKCVLN